MEDGRWKMEQHYQAVDYHFHSIMAFIIVWRIGKSAYAKRPYRVGRDSNPANGRWKMENGTTLPSNRFPFHSIMAFIVVWRIGKSALRSCYSNNDM